MDTPVADLQRALEVARGFTRRMTNITIPKYRPIHVDHARMAAEDALPLDRWADDGGRA